MARNRGWLLALGALACSSSESPPIDPGGNGARDASHADASDSDARDARAADAIDARIDVGQIGTGTSTGGLAGAAGASGSAAGGPSTSGAGGASMMMGGAGGAAGSTTDAGGMGTAGTGALDAGLDGNSSGGAGGTGGGGAAGGPAGTGGAAGAGGTTVVCPQPDVDGDGYRSVACGGNDCNDNDPAIHPYAADDWDVQVVEHTTFASPSYGSLATAIGVTSQGAVHIVRRVDAELYDFTNETGSWVGTRVTAGPATYPVVAIDATNDVVRVAFAGDEADVATRVNPSTWTIGPIDPASVIPGLVVASSGVLHSAYTVTGASQLRHASTATGSWSYEVVPTVVGAALSPAYAPAQIAIDKLGAIHIAYRQHYSSGRIPSNTVESATNASGSWVAASVGQGENISQAIAAASAGGFHGAAVVELGIGRDTDLIYFGASSALLPKRVEPNILSTPAIGVAAGRVHIAHAAMTSVNFVFHHALRVASAPETGAAAWDYDSVEVVATASAPSIAVDANGAIHVAYLVQIDANGTFELHYARRAAPDGIDQDCDGHPG